MRAAGAVHEIEVHVDRFVIPAEARRQPVVPMLPAQGFGPLRILGAVHLVAGQGRHEDFRFEPGGGHERGFGGFRRQYPVGNEEHVGIEPHAFVAGPHLGHDAVDLYRFPARYVALGGDDIVELQELLGGHADPELQWGGVLGSDHPADRVRRRVRLGFHHGPQR